MSTHPTDPGGTTAPESAWQDRLIALAQRRGAGAPDDARIVPELWRILHVKLLQHVAAQSRRLGPLQPEDVEDLAARKALDLLNRIDSGQWDAARARPAEVVAFVSTVARNGVVDALRQAARAPWAGNDPEAPMPADASLEQPDDGIQRQEFARALVACAATLKEAPRRIWMFRTFYDMSSKQIAAHPEVMVKSTHVDVILQRARQRLRTCMRAKGLDATDMPAGAFAELWLAFRLDAVTKEGESDAG